MSDTRDYTAAIKSKGLDATGVTEQVARALYSRLGGRIMAIVELRVDARTDGTDGTHKVQLGITQVEPALDGHLSDHLRELTRTLYYNRQVASGDQPTLETEDGSEPTVDAVMAAGAQHRPHPYITSQLAIDNGDAGPICDVCGQLETDARHIASTSGVGDPFAVPHDDTDEPAESDLHEFIEGDEPDQCAECGRSAYDAEIHSVASTRRLASVKES